MLNTTLVVSFCKDGGGSVNVKLRYLVGFYYSVITMMHGPTNIKLLSRLEKERHL